MGSIFTPVSKKGGKSDYLTCYIKTQKSNQQYVCSIYYRLGQECRGYQDIHLNRKIKIAGSHHLIPSEDIIVLVIMSLPFMTAINNEIFLRYLFT